MYRFAARFDRFQTACRTCGKKTTKTYASANGGQCKACVTGVDTSKRNRNRSCNDNSLKESE